MAAGKSDTDRPKDLQEIQNRAEEAGKAACRQSNGKARAADRLADAKSARSS